MARKPPKKAPPIERESVGTDPADGSPPPIEQATIRPYAFPLAYDRQGERIPVPAHAAGWRILRSGRRSGPTNVRTANGPVILPVTATAEDLGYLCGPGAFELLLVDANETQIEPRRAYIVLAVEDTAATDGDGQNMSGASTVEQRALLDSNTCLREALSTTTKALAEVAQRALGLPTATIHQHTADDTREIVAVEAKPPANPEGMLETIGGLAANLRVIADTVRPLLPSRNGARKPTESSE